jgi:hypothetical protein
MPHTSIASATFVALWLALGGATAGAQPLDGIFRRGESASDRMEVHVTPAGELWVRIETLGPAGHTCELQEVIELRGDVARYSDLEDAARDWSITFEGERAIVAYSGAQRGYCSAGADFRGEWRRAPR